VSDPAIAGLGESWGAVDLTARIGNWDFSCISHSI
jgi:hypothetical protein